MNLRKFIKYLQHNNYILPIICYSLFVLVHLFIPLKDNLDNFKIFETRWDIAHYKCISESGYSIYPCKKDKPYPEGEICGNPWFPMWPLVNRFVGFLTGLDVDTSFPLLAFLFTLGSFLLLYRFVKERFDVNVASFSVFSLIFFPGSFYLLTGFPYAMLVFLMLLYLLFYYKENLKYRYLVLAFLAVLISLSYTSGFLLFVLPFCHITIKAFSEKKDKFDLNVLTKELFIVCGPFFIGLFLLCTYFYISHGDFLLILHFNRKYNRTWDFLLRPIVKSFKQYPISLPNNFSIFWFGLLFIIFYKFKKENLEIFLYVLFVYFFSPFTGSTESVYRHYMLLFPSLILLGVSNRSWILKFFWVILGAYVSICIYFPKYIDGSLI